MLQFSANLSTLFQEVDFLNRFERASASGFKGVEIQFPYAWPAEKLVDKLLHFDLQLVLHNLPPGNWDTGDRGMATFPDRVGEFQDSVGQGLEYARELQCPCLNCLVGLAPQGFSADKVWQTLVDNLRFAAATLQAEEILLVVEMLNSIDVPGFYLTSSRDGLELIEAVDHPNLKLQYDVYHMQCMEGDPARTIQENIERIGHIQIADYPGRHQPGTGEIDFDNLFGCIEESGYQGWIGCEYFPLGKTEETLQFLHTYRSRSPDPQG